MQRLVVQDTLMERDEMLQMSVISLTQDLRKVAEKPGFWK
jgi:hypothetical protein